MMRKSKKHLRKGLKFFCNGRHVGSQRVPRSTDSANSRVDMLRLHSLDNVDTTSLQDGVMTESGGHTNIVSIDKEVYFEILGFEQSSAMQIVSHYASDCSIVLRIADSATLYPHQEKADKGSDALSTTLSQEYGIIAQGSTQNLAAFFQILESLFNDRLIKGNVVAFVLRKLQQLGYKLCVAESCTGGRLSAMITAINGASSVFKGGITAYSIESKQRILGIKDSIFKEYSVYSEACVSAMARGVLDLFQADVAIATSGLAADDDSLNNFLKLPVGTVFTCVLIKGKLPISIAHNYLLDASSVDSRDSRSFCYTGEATTDSRAFVQKMASVQSLRLLLSALAC